MPFNYKPIKVQAALKLAQLTGSSQDTFEAAYTGAWVDALDGAEIPISAFRDVAMMVAKEIANVIGNNPNDPNRSFLYGRSDDLANLASIPTTDVNGHEFIGTFDSVADGDNDQPLTLQPTQTLADVANTFFSDTDFYYYNITGNQIRHTRDTVYLQGCIWDEDAQIELWDDDGDCPLPQACASLLVNGICANSQQVGWVDQAQAVAGYANLYQQGLQMLAGAQNSEPLSAANPVAG